MATSGIRKLFASLDINYNDSLNTKLHKQNKVFFTPSSYSEKMRWGRGWSFSLFV